MAMMQLQIQEDATDKNIYGENGNFAVEGYVYKNFLVEYKNRTVLNEGLDELGIRAENLEPHGYLVNFIIYYHNKPYLMCSGLITGIEELNDMLMTNVHLVKAMNYIGKKFSTKELDGDFIVDFAESISLKNILNDEKDKTKAAIAYHVAKEKVEEMEDKPSMVFIATSIDFVGETKSINTYSKLKRAQHKNQISFKMATALDILVQLIKTCADGYALPLRGCNFTTEARQDLITLLIREHEKTDSIVTDEGLTVLFHLPLEYAKLIK